MFAFTSYQFGYSWYISYGLVVPLALAGALGALAVWRGWARWISVLAGVVVVWAVIGMFLINVVWGINSPMELPTARFLASGSGRVLDAGAGSGRSAVGLLLARPRATVTGLDIYQGYWGIDDNTPERFMTNARIAGVADRAETRTGDMRDMPFRSRIPNKHTHGFPMSLGFHDVIITNFLGQRPPPAAFVVRNGSKLSP